MSFGKSVRPLSRPPIVDSFASAVPIPVGRRGASRVRLILPAQIDAVCGTFNVSLVSLSCSGAMLAGLPETLRTGSEIVLRSGPLDEFASVVWSRDRRCGITFDGGVPEEQVIALRDYSDALANMPEHEQFVAARLWCRGEGAR